MIDLSKKTPRELIKLLDSVKVSDLEFDKKTALIKEIEYRLNGTRDKNLEALKQIEEGMADVSDIVGQVWDEAKTIPNRNRHFWKS